VVRVFVLDFDSLPSRPAEVIPLLRFRLRKMIPFDVETAGVSYQVLVENKTECKVLVAVIPGLILQEYEAAVREAGYEPGAVLSTSLAALGAIDTSEAVLAANLGAVTFTTSITNGQDLLLYRTLDLPEDPGLRLQEVQRGVSVAAAYFEDKLGARPQRLHFAGIGVGIGTGGSNAAEEFARWISSPEVPELTVVDLAPRPETGAATPLGNVLTLAGVAGALAGAN
jgi:type IV pilus assembly protein PilM